MIHFLGSLQLMSSFGGIDNLFVYYPHLQLPLTHVAHFETMWIVLSQIPIRKQKQASRRAVEMLCHASHVKRRFFNPCPASLTLIIYDIGALATRILESHNTIALPDSYARKQILHNVLAFQPESGAQDVVDAYYKDGPL